MHLLSNSEGNADLSVVSDRITVRLYKYQLKIWRIRITLRENA